MPPYRCSALCEYDERAEHIGVLLLALSGDIELPGVKGGGQAIAFSFTGPTLLVRQ